jgi:hypothetical protein
VVKELCGQKAYDHWRTPAFVVTRAEDSYYEFYGRLIILRALDPELAMEVATRAATELHARFGR